MGSDMQNRQLDSFEQGKLQLDDQCLKVIASHSYINISPAG